MEISIDDPFFKEKLKVTAALYRVVDPELFVNIMDLGLVYDISLSRQDKIVITMTLSTPHCPLGEAITNGVKQALSLDFPGREVEVKLVWDPPWNPSMMTEEGKQLLGI